ncbi:MAG: hypothetical protein AB7V27_01960 [Candidatus Binatia bacterium]
MGRRTRFAYALAVLQTHRRPFGAARPRDPRLDVFRTLAASRFRSRSGCIRSGRWLPEDVQYIAVALAEQFGEPRAVAEGVLAHLAARHGRAKVGRAAHNKLQLLQR